MERFIDDRIFFSLVKHCISSYNSRHILPYLTGNLSRHMLDFEARPLRHHMSTNMYI